MATIEQSEFIPLRRAAMRLGVPIAWLRAESDAGRLPHLKIGQRRLLNLDAVRRALAERAAETKETENDIAQK